MSNVFIEIDFEFNDSSERFPNLVSCCFEYKGKDHKYWLHYDNDATENFHDNLKALVAYEGSKGNRVIFIAWAVEAEARSFLAASLEARDYNFIDLWLEYRCLLNKDNSLSYGKQLIDGKVKRTSPPKPKWEMTEEDKLRNAYDKPQDGLGAGVFKLLGIQIDTHEKQVMRNIIISQDIEKIELNKDAILNYNMSDIKHLIPCFKKIVSLYKQRDPSNKTLLDEMLLRGKYAVATAYMVSEGYPIDLDATQAFSDNVKEILASCIRDINDQFPEIKPFSWMVQYQMEDRKIVLDENGKPIVIKSYFKMNQKNIKDWIAANHDVDKWMKTDKKDVSLKFDAFRAFYDYRHDYPRNNFGAQMIRFLNLKQNLNGFSTSGNTKKTIWDSIGKDGRVRPYFNIYRAQSSRSQPSATAFLFLKSAWMRSLVQPKPGKAICTIDYKSQEFLIDSIEYGDMNGINAYRSGDVYFFFAKKTGAVPKDAVRVDYEEIRNKFKSTVLGLQFKMTKYGLAIKLTADTGVKTSEEDAQELIDDFNDTFPDKEEGSWDALEDYKDEGFIKLPCLSGETHILTKNGNKLLKNITIKDKLWDGMNWVKHGGVVAKGVKDVILSQETQSNVTPDHLILKRGVWYPAAELEVLGESLSQKSGNYSEDGRLLLKRSRSNPEGLSFAAAYVNLKNSLELTPYKPEKLEPVLTALNPCALKEEGTLPQFLMTNILNVSGGQLTTMQSIGVKIRTTNNGETMEVGGFPSALTPLEVSWNTFLNWMGVETGTGHWTELTMTGITDLETYESLAKDLIIKTEEVYDVINCGPRKRFQAGHSIVSNCGWYMWGDNDNDRSIMNVPIQGKGASIMRRAVLNAQKAGLKVIKTLHDALYIEYDSWDTKAIDILAECMDEAFKYYFRDHKLKKYAEVGLDACCWSPDYEDGFFKSPKGLGYVSKNYYVDDRAKTQYEYFKKYLSKPEGLDLI